MEPSKNSASERTIEGKEVMSNGISAPPQKKEEGKQDKIASETQENLIFSLGANVTSTAWQMKDTIEYGRYYHWQSTYYCNMDIENNSFYTKGLWKDQTLT